MSENRVLQQIKESHQATDDAWRKLAISAMRLSGRALSTLTPAEQRSYGNLVQLGFFKKNAEPGYLPQVTTCVCNCGKIADCSDVPDGTLVVKQFVCEECAPKPGSVTAVEAAKINAAAVAKAKLAKAKHDDSVKK